MRNLTASVLTLTVLVPSLAFGETSSFIDGPKGAIKSDPPRMMSSGPIRMTAAREAERQAKLEPPALAQQQTQQRSWASRHPVALGALIGLGAGFGYGAATCSPALGDQGPCSASTYEWRPRLASGTFLGLIGTGVGAGIGAIVSAVRP